METYLIVLNSDNYLVDREHVNLSEQFVCPRRSCRSVTVLLRGLSKQKKRENFIDMKLIN